MDSAFEKLKKLSTFKIHSIEQPISVKKRQEMAFLCEKSPIPIALDEELIGIPDFKEQKEMLLEINPTYIILKPSLIGGLKKGRWLD